MIWTSVIPRFFIGIDNTDLFYDVPVGEKALELEGIDNKGINDALKDGHRFKGKIMSYVVEPCKTIFDKFVEASKRLGLACQVRIPAAATGFFVSAEPQPLQ